MINLNFDTVFFVIDVLVLVYFGAVNGLYLMLIGLSYFSILNYNRLIRNEPWRMVIQSPTTIPISIIAPAYNEEKDITSSIKSLLSLHYPAFEIVVVNDGSQDNTLQRLKEDFGLHEIPAQPNIRIYCREIRGVYRSPKYRNLVVVDKVNGGKADALNAGINISRYPIFCAIDADSVMESESLLRITRPFMESPRTTAAVGGIIRVANGCTIEGGYVRKIGVPRSWLASIQIVEYMRAFLFGRTGWNMLKGLLIISGAFGVFNKQAVIDIGGYARDTVGEDMELVTRLHHVLKDQEREYDISFIPDPICWTEVPETFRGLARQRNRWQRGLIDSLRRHKGMFFNPRYGILGMLAFPYFFFVEMLGPVLEIAGYIIVIASYALGMLDTQFFLLFLSLAILLGIVLSSTSLILDELSFHRYPRKRDMLKLLLAAVLENFGYRQLHTWWRFTGMLDYLRKKQGWGRMERRGFEQQPKADK